MYIYKNNIFQKAHCKILKVKIFVPKYYTSMKMYLFNMSSIYYDGRIRI